jgi:hypothetical protein
MNQKSEPNPVKRGIPMELIFMIGFFVFWFFLQLWVLPKMGIRT